MIDGLAMPTELARAPMAWRRNLCCPAAVGGVAY